MSMELVEDEQIGKLRQGLYRYCLQLTASFWEADDLVQETSIRTLAYLNGERAHPNLSALLQRTAKNIWIDQCRRRWKFDAIMREQLRLVVTNEEVMEPHMDIEQLIEVLCHKLSPLQLTVFLLRDVFNYSAVESASLLRTSEGAVKAALFRARRGLARMRSEKITKQILLDSCHMEDEQQSMMVRAYVRAMQSSDVSALAALALVQLQSADQTTAVGFPSVSLQQSPASRVDSSHLTMTLRAAS